MIRSIAASLLFAISLSATVINVPADQTTIQAGIYTAENGDTVLVQPGTYTENLLWPETNGIKLLSSGDSSNTIISGSRISTVITMIPQVATIDSNTVIKGFTVTNGGNVVNGGGVILIGASPSYIDVQVDGNIATGSGGGFYLINSDSKFTGMSISNNTANTGGGMFLDTSNPIIMESVFFENEASGSAGGGGIYLSESNPTLEQVFFNANYGYQGGGIRMQNSSPSLVDDIFVNNSANNGGGLCLDYYSDPVLINVNISDNTANWRGGGLFLDDYCDPTLDSVIVSNNSAGQKGGGFYIEVSSPSLSNVTIRNNTANLHGGGVHIIAGNAIFHDVEIINNSAIGDGGGLYIVNSHPTFTNMKVSKNSATGRGGGFYIERCNINLYGTSVLENTSSGNGGGIYVQGFDPVFSGMTIYGNIGAQGGGLFLDGTNASLTNVNIVTNTSTAENSSAIYITSENPSIINSNIINNGDALFNLTNTNTINATNNFWGHASGPAHALQNPNGLGDIVNTYVNVTPWASIPNIDAPPPPVQNLQISHSGIDYIELQWDDSQISDLVGYRVYTRTDSSSLTYSDTFEVGIDTSYTLQNLSAGLVYWISVTCYDTDNNESCPTIDLSASAQPAPIINVNPLLLDYESILVGEYHEMELTVANSGTDDLLVNEIIHSTGNIEISATSFEIPVGGENIISIQVNPTQYGLSVDTLVIQNNSFNHPSFYVPVQWFGDLPENPVILSVSDIPDDQGGKVRISFSGSKYDGYDDSQSIISYTVWRHLETDTWDAIGMFNAVQDSIYHFVAPTLCDSSGEGVCWSSFKVSAHTSDADVYYFSDSLGGYSVDNIAPSTPSGFMAAGVEGGIHLTWNSIREEDFQYFAIYRSTQENFDPDTINAPQFTTIDTNFTDNGIESPGTYYYRIAAFDYAGNESEYSDQAFAVVVSINPGITLPTEFVLDQNYPNPFNPSTTIRYGLPEEANVSLVIYDVRGQVVQTLESAHQSAGWYDVVWNGETADGKTISTGIYFARLVAGEYSQVIKMLYLK